VITVQRGANKHAIDNAHCDATPLDALEELIDSVANTKQWIGTRPD
jgi:hypothetical protein